MNRSLITLALFALVGCSVRTARTEVVVEIDAESSVLADATGLHVTVMGAARGDALTTQAEQSLGGTSEIPWPVTVALVPADADADRVFAVEGVATSASGETLGIVRARSSYVSGRTLTLRLTLEDCCRTVAGSCSAEETCRSCECVPATVEPTTLPDWDADAGTIPDRDSEVPAPDAADPDAGVPDAAPDADAGVDAGSDAGSDAATSTFTPRNLTAAVWDDATGSVSVTASASINTDTGAVIVDGSASRGFDALDVAPIGECAGIFVMVTGEFRVATGAIVTVTGSRGLAIVASGDIVIDGTIDVGAHGSAGGPGALVRTGNGYGSEGGPDGCSTVTAPTFGNAELAGLCGGANIAGSGGGGGALELASGAMVEIGATGIIRAVGGGGASRTVAPWAGSGGSGGSVLIQSPIVRIAGVVSVNGGGGGNNSGRAAPVGEDGAVTRRAASGVPLLTDIAWTYGAGGSGAWYDGAAGGGEATRWNGMSECRSGGIGGSAGGGGAGRVRVDSVDTGYVAGSLLEYTISGVFSEGTL